MRPGTLLLVLLLVTLYATQYSRRLLHEEGPPVFFLEEREGVTVMLGEGFPEPGIHQFNDGVTLAGVIEMTLPEVGLEQSPSAAMKRPVLSGEAIAVRVIDGEVVEITREWMPASHRITLHLSLHPDRMNLRDWEALPGIGPKLAQRIEEDRQRNGDFGSLETLERVPGIGPGRIAAWKSFF